MPADVPGEADEADKTDAQTTGPGDAAKTGTQDFLAALADTPTASGRTPDAAGTRRRHGTGTGAGGGLGPVRPRGRRDLHCPDGARRALGQVPMTIGLRSLAGSSEFQIRLDRWNSGGST